MKTVDIIIPSYKPTKDFIDLLLLLEKQTYPVNKVFITNTEEKYFNLLFLGSRFFETRKNIEITHISKLEFDHGRTRALMVEKSSADFFICMTCDAVPKDTTLVEHLLAPLLSKEAAISYARQLPREDCREIERFTRDFNYPAVSEVKSKESLNSKGIKTYFCSNVCAAYNREIYDELGGFDRHMIFNEDMLFAAKAIHAGFKVAYVAEAEVIHSHNLSNSVQFRRNFDLGVSQAQHPEYFGAVSSTSEGKTLVRLTASHLLEVGKWYLIPRLIFSSAAKYLGYRKGKNYQKLSDKKIMKYTGNRTYWLQSGIQSPVASDGKK